MREHISGGGVGWKLYIDTGGSDERTAYCMLGGGGCGTIL